MTTTVDTNYHYSSHMLVIGLSDGLNRFDWLINHVTRGKVTFGHGSGNEKQMRMR